MAARKKRSRGPKTQQRVRAAFREVSREEPEAVKRTRRKQGSAAAERQRKAIALDKARRRGARIPKR